MVTVFIEGSSNDKNGNLRQGFGKLFEQKLNYYRLQAGRFAESLKTSKVIQIS